MPDSDDRRFRPNERVAETLAKADQKRMQEIMARRQFVGAPLHQTTVARRNPTDGVYPTMSREEEWRLIRQVSSQLTPEGQKGVIDEISRSNREFFEKHYPEEAALKEEEKQRAAKVIRDADLADKIAGPAEVYSKPVPNDPTPIDKAREIGQNLQKSGVAQDKGFEPDKG